MSRGAGRAGSGSDGWARELLARALRELVSADRRRIEELRRLRGEISSAVNTLMYKLLPCEYEPYRDECRAVQEARETVLKVIDSKIAEAEREAKKRVLNELLNLALR